MTWNKIDEILAEELCWVEPVRVPQSKTAITLQDWLRFIIRLESRTRRAVDIIAIQFAESKCRPNMTSVQEYFYRERLFYASHITQALSVPFKFGKEMFESVPMIDLTEREVIEWLLVQVWRKSNRERWLGDETAQWHLSKQLKSGQ